MDLFGFSAMWEFMHRWRALFQQYDRDRSGCISGAELQQGIPVWLCVCSVLEMWGKNVTSHLLSSSSALAQMGYNLSPQFSEALVRRFSVPGRRPGIHLDCFIQVCTQLQSMTQVFRERDTAMTGNIRLNYEDFLSGAITRLM